MARGVCRRRAEADQAEARGGGDIEGDFGRSAFDPAAFDDVAGIGGRGVRVDGVVVGDAVKEFVEPDGFEVAVRGRGKPEGNQQQAGELTEARHGTDETGGRAGVKKAGGGEEG